MKRLSTIIIDGNAGARDNLRELCKSRTELHLVAECGGSEEARRDILAHRPDLLFLAAKLDGGTGFDLVRELPEGTAPMIVFVSANEEFALQAFELGALDYILKPVAYNRFCGTIQRVIARARASESRASAARLRSDDRGAATRHSSSLDLVHRPSNVNGFPRLIIEIGDRIHFVDVAEVESIEADRNYVWINTQDSYRVRASLKQIDSMLPPESFFRVNRSVIINAAFIASMERCAHGEYAIHLNGGGVFTTGRRFRGQIPGIVLRRHGRSPRAAAALG